MNCLTFIILSWNSQQYLAQCYNSIISKCEKENIPYEVITIDNGSADASISIIDRYIEIHAPNFNKIILPQNQGTTYTRNLGLKKAIGNYVCFLDSDTELHEGTLSMVLKVLDNRPDIGIIAPQLLLPDGSTQNSVKKFPSFPNKLVKLTKTFCGIKLPDHDYYEGFPFESETSVDSAISACWFFRKELISQVGFLDEKIFYAPEDLDFSLRVRLAGKKIIYYPYLRILHHTQQISHKKPLSRISISHLFGLFYYFNKHGGWLSTRTLYRKIEETARSKILEVYKTNTV
jgi:GT2 family glycosyltransferase